PSFSFALNAEGCLVVSVPYLYTQPLVTHDIAELADETSFRWLGRSDNVINSGGVKLYPEQMERKIREAGLLKGDFYITSKTDEKLGQVPVIVTVAGSAEADLDSLNALLDKYEKLS